MHYRDITDVIVSNNLVSSSGQTPANTVRNILTTTKGLFLRIADGEYSLTTDGQKYVVKHAPKFKSKSIDTDKDVKPDEVRDVEVLIPSYGMFWMRDGINWNSHPKLLGVQSTGATPIDLSEMRGVYMLYDGREIIYVGQAIDRSILNVCKNILRIDWQPDGIGFHGSV